MRLGYPWAAACLGRDPSGWPAPGSSQAPEQFCVFITAVPICTKLSAGGGRGITIAHGITAPRDDEPRPLWTILPITHE
jgi:hypothetical protein